MILCTYCTYTRRHELARSAAECDLFRRVSVPSSRRSLVGSSRLCPALFTVLTRLLLAASGCRDVLARRSASLFTFCGSLRGSARCSTASALLPRLLFPACSRFSSRPGHPFASKPLDRRPRSSQMPLAAVCQLTSTPFVSKNTATATSLLDRAAKAGAEFICLPEACDWVSTGEGDKLVQETPAFVDAIRQTAKRNSVWVSVGIHARGDGEERLFNEQLLISDVGEVVQRYRKLHLFSTVRFYLLPVAIGTDLAGSRYSRCSRRRRPSPAMRCSFRIKRPSVESGCRRATICDSPKLR